MVRPRRTKPDLNQSEVTANLEARGYEVFDVHDMADFVDIIVLGKGKQSGIACACLGDVKSGDKDLSDKQKRFWASMIFPSVYVLVHTWEDVAEWFAVR